MRLPLALSARVLLTTSVLAAEVPAPSADQPLLRTIAADIDAKALESTIRYSRWIPAGTTATLKEVVIDDWFFGVLSVTADGWESPVVLPGAAGSFESPPPAPPTPPK